MVDMGQADSSLYRKPASMEHKMCWTRALQRAAEKMGFKHYMDVPENLTSDLKTLARLIQGGEGIHLHSSGRSHALACDYLKEQP